MPPQRRYLTAQWHPLLKKKTFSFPCSSNLSAKLMLSSVRDAKLSPAYCETLPCQIIAILRVQVWIHEGFTQNINSRPGYGRKSGALSKNLEDIFHIPVERLPVQAYQSYVRFKGRPQCDQKECWCFKSPKNWELIISMLMSMLNKSNLLLMETLNLLNGS